jgi:hypothetical protein
MVNMAVIIICGNHKLSAYYDILYIFLFLNRNK